MDTRILLNNEHIFHLISCHRIESNATKMVAKRFEGWSIQTEQANLVNQLFDFYFIGAAFKCCADGVAAIV